MNPYEILKILSDGSYHSGESLAKRFGVTRGTVWKALQRLQDAGFDFYRIRGRGYAIPGGVELLNEQSIFSHLPEAIAKEITLFKVLEVVDSTNNWLLKNANKQSKAICLAEQQTKGKGRHGRTWFSPPAVNIYLSLSWCFERSMRHLAGLSLAVGVAVAKALSSLNYPDIQLKWPNDLVYKNKKLGGILVDLYGDGDGPQFVIIGVGINVSLSQFLYHELPIEQPWVDLRTISSQKITRSKIAALVISELFLTLKEFQSKGFKEFQSQWLQYDALAGKQVVVKKQRNDFIRGLAEGVDEEGHLLVKTNQGIEVLASGVQGVRLVPH